MDVEKEIERTAGRLLAGEDIHVVLREFAGRIQSPVTRLETKHTCVSCGQEDVLCFGCKVTDSLGDQAGQYATVALPMLIPKVAQLVQQWYAQRQARRAVEEVAAQQQAQAAYAQQQAQQQARRGPPPPPPGRQTF